MALDTYVRVGIEVIAAFGIILVFLKFFGMKTQLKEMTTLDLIINLTLSAILGGFIIDDRLSLAGFFVVMTMYGALVYVVNLISQRTRWGRKMFIGVPEVVIIDGKIQIDVMKKLNLGVRDLASALRTYKIHSMDEVKMAQVEPGGTLTIVKKGGESYQVVIIDDGVLDIDALKSIGKNEKWLKLKLSEKKIKQVSDVFVAQWHKGKLHIVKKS